MFYIKLNQIKLFKVTIATEFPGDKIALQINVISSFMPKLVQ